MYVEIADDTRELLDEVSLIIKNAGRYDLVYKLDTLISDVRNPIQPEDLDDEFEGF